METIIPDIPQQYKFWIQLGIYIATLFFLFREVTALKRESKKTRESSIRMEENIKDLREDVKSLMRKVFGVNGGQV